MILGIDQLHYLVKTKKLVENLCERELNNPEGAGFDLRLGEVYEISGQGFLGVEERQTPKIKLMAEYNEKKKNSFVFKPKKYYLIKTIEKVNTPADILILFRPRTTMFRSGLAVFTGNASPGYCGELNFGLANLGPGEIKVELGARVVHAMFYQVKGKTRLYRGQWQGGRVSAKKKKNKYKKMDQEIQQLIEREISRQRDGLTLIPSENYASVAVLRAMGTPLSNKYAEGYPAKRYYGGNEVIDEIEQVAIERAKKLFGAEHANVQPHAGSQANAAVYLALLKPGDRVLGFDLAAGGHLTHGSPVNFSGQFYNFAYYGVDRKTELIDMAAVEKIALEFQPKLIVTSTTSYSRQLDFEAFSRTAKKVNAYLMADIAHIAGLVAADEHPHPFPWCDVATGTTHKTLRGPRGGLILCKKELAEKIDKAVFPGLQGGPLENIIAAKAVCFAEALQPEFKEYQQRVVLNAKAMAGEFVKEGWRVISGGTDNHLLVLDLSKQGIDALVAQTELDKVGIYTNRNAIPFDKKPAFNPSGLRLGSPAVTSRGFKEKECVLIAQLISRVLKNLDNQTIKDEVEKKVRELAKKFPIYKDF